MRKALFAIVLVGASFAGGAVVNGPGLRWAQTMILDRLGGESEGDSDSDSENQAGLVSDPQAPKVSAEASEPIPSSPIPPLVVESPPASSAASHARLEEKDKERQRERKKNVPGSPTSLPALAAPEGSPSQSAQALATAAAAAATPESKAPEPLESQRQAPGREPAGSGPPDDPRIALVKGPGPEPSPLEALDPLPLTGPGEPAAAKERPGGSDWSDAPGSAPAAAVPPRAHEPGLAGAEKSAPAPAPIPLPAAAPTASAATGRPGDAADETAPPTPPSPSPSAPSSDWAEIRRKMTALGVSRYGIEGEPNGRVRFHCVIPLAGRRAVAQQFEAEGDDDLQAAEAALRRVALWRATENPGP